MIKKIFRKIKLLFKLKPSVDHNAIFTEIYNRNIWGSDGKSKFYSGSGSDSIHAEPYTKLIIEFIRHNNIQSLVDLGSGDFRVGRAIIDATNIKYTGVDVVKELVDYNNAAFGNNTISFLNKNITKDSLPDGDLCVIRQVLQHLSNRDIIQVLKRTRKYKYLIVTEHLPLNQSQTPNIDKVPDGSIRYYQNSGVYLDLPPFNRKVRELLSIEPDDHPDSRIVTFQITG